jgi:hypothetical protein
MVWENVIVELKFLEHTQITILFRTLIENMFGFNMFLRGEDLAE